MSHLISRKKEVYPIKDFLAYYLAKYGRFYRQGIRYEALMRYNNAVPLYDEHGNDTLWSTVLYPQYEQQEIHDHLRMAYAILKANGDFSIAEHLYIERVDLCHYGNTLPFRVRIVNRLNENFDYFYVKRVDANRIYGLELEHILSPNRINYFIHEDTIIEEHIIGVPGDIFLREFMPNNRFNLVRLSKEFVKFSERCFVLLLGDMHAGNFVIDMNRDFEKMHYRMRPIDFDQQSNHWRKEVYMPQRFGQNDPFVKTVLKYLAPANITQYKKEERALMANRARVSAGRFDELMEVMCEDLIAPDAYVERLRDRLASHYDQPQFTHCDTMGELVSMSIQQLASPRQPVSSPTAL